MSNKCKGAWHFPYFIGHIVQHAICTWRKHFLINENSHIESYLSYFLKNKPWLTFFLNQNFSAYFWDYFLCTFWYFLLHLSWSIFLVHSLILFYLILESAYSQTLLYFHRNTVRVEFQLIVRKILVLSNPPRMTTSIF